MGFSRIYPSGKRLHSYGKSPCLMGKSTISTGPFSIATLSYQRVTSTLRINHFWEDFLGPCCLLGKVAWFNQRLWFKSQTYPFLIPTAPPSEDMDRDWAYPTSLKKIGIGQRCQSHPQKWRRSRRWCNILICCKLEDCMKVKVHQTGFIYRSLTIYQYIQFNMNIYEYMFQI